MWEIEIIGAYSENSNRRFRSKSEPIISEQTQMIKFTCAETKRPFIYSGYRFNVRGPEAPFVM